MKPRSKLLKRSYRVSEQGANRSKKTKEIQRNEQAARKELENFRTRSKPLERDSSIRKRLENLKAKNKLLEKKEQAARKRLGHLNTRGKPLERIWRISEQGASRLKQTRKFNRDSRN